MATFLFTHALRDYLRPKRVVTWVALAIALFAVGKVFMLSSTDTTPAEAYQLLSGLIVFRLLALMSAIFATAIVSQEVEQKTIVYLLTRPIPRWQMLLSRWLAAAVAVGGIAVIAVLANALSTLGGFSPAVARDLLAIVTGAFAYTALFLLVSLLLNRAMVVCLIFAFGWESAVPSMQGELYLLTINSHLNVIAERAAGDAQGVMSALAGTAKKIPLATWQAWLALAGIVTVCTMFNLSWFSKNEYVPREDGE
ncbi:MAG: ABC transporter permease subunit [Fimbriimonadaceae bacterium]|nr:ABC transporter permease subunit [Fimbriimonadaceae bacterium]